MDILVINKPYWTNPNGNKQKIMILWIMPTLRLNARNNAVIYQITQIKMPAACLPPIKIATPSAFTH
jgi:hypothetical protein